jgi:hypothetical protein
MTEQKLHRIIDAAILSHAEILGRRYVASAVLDGDMTIFNRQDEGLDFVETDPPVQAALTIQKLASIFTVDLQKTVPLSFITFVDSTSPAPSLSQPASDHAKITAELAFARACFTGDAFLQTLAQVAYSVVSWGAAPVVQDNAHWAGRFVPLRNFLTSRDEKSSVEFGYIDPRELYDHYTAATSRAKAAAAIDPAAPPLPEAWSPYAIERLLCSHLDSNQSLAADIKAQLAYDISQYINPHDFRTLHNKCGPHVFSDFITSRVKPIPVARVIHTDIEGNTTLYILPHPGPEYVQQTSAEAAATRKRSGIESLVVVRAPATPTRVSATTSASAAAPHPDWPTLLYRSNKPAHTWVSLIEPQRTHPDSTVHNAKGAAYSLVKLYLSRSRDIAEYRGKRLVTDSLTNLPSGTSSKPKVQRHGPFIATNLTPQTNQLGVRWDDYAATVALTEQDIASVVRTLDPQLADQLSRATTAEIAERGGAIRSQRSAYAAERAVALSGWLTNAYNTLLSKPPSSGPSATIFWSTLFQSLHRVPEFEAKDLPSFIAKARPLLKAFEVDISFEDVSLEVLRQRLSMTTDPASKRRLEIQMRLVLGEDPSVLVRSLSAPAASTEEVSSASVENYVITNGQFVPVEERQNHWNHFLTHNAKFTEIVTTLQQNPNTDPVAALTSLTQLGRHMADHRDIAAEHAFYVQYVEQMNGALKAVMQVVNQLAPAAKEAALRAHEAGQPPPPEEEAPPPSDDPLIQAKLERQQASWQQRFEQRNAQAEAQAKRDEERHALNLRIMADKAALQQQIKIATAK